MSTTGSVIFFGGSAYFTWRFVVQALFGQNPFLGVECVRGCSVLWGFSQDPSGTVDGGLERCLLGYVPGLWFYFLLVLDSHNFSRGES